MTTGAQLVTTDRNTAIEKNIERGRGDHEKKKENENDQRMGEDAKELN